LNIYRLEKLTWAARLITVLTPVTTLLYALSLALLATLRFSIPVGAFQGATIMFFPYLVGFAFVGWKWPLFGGLLVLTIGILTIFPICSASGWPAYYTIPYLVLEAIYAAGGVLYLAVAIIKWRQG
jgi:hypothetical protein